MGLDDIESMLLEDPLELLPHPQGDRDIDPGAVHRHQRVPPDPPEAPALLVPARVVGRDDGHLVSEAPQLARRVMHDLGDPARLGVIGLRYDAYSHCSFPRKSRKMHHWSLLRDM